MKFFLSIASVAVVAFQAAAELRAGVAKSDISIENPNTRINDPVYAKVIVLEDDDTRMAIIAMDVTAIGGIGEVGDDFLPQLRARIEDELNIPGKHVLVNASHNHPPINFVCDAEQQLERTFDAVRRAAASMKPVVVGAGSGHEDRISMNRTLTLKDGRQWTIRHTNPSPPDDEVVSVGTMDPEIGVLRIDRTDGTPLAVIYNFACHPYITVPKGGVTADFPGFASAVIEESLGNDAMAIFLQGAGGDITEVLYKDTSRPRDAEPLGRMLGLSTLKAWRRIEPKDAAIDVINESLPLPRKSDFDERVADLEAEQESLLKGLRGTSLNFKGFLPLYIKYMMNPEHPSYYSYRYLQSEITGHDDLSGIDDQNRAHINKYLRNVEAMEKLARIQDKIATLRRHQKLNSDAGEPTVETEVQGMKIGDLYIVTSPAEVCVEVGLNVKRDSPHEYTFMAAYSNGYIHYGPPATMYPGGGYEVTECLLDPAWQAMYERKANDVIRRLN